MEEYASAIPMTVFEVDSFLNIAELLSSASLPFLPFKILSALRD